MRVILACLAAHFRWLRLTRLGPPILVHAEAGPRGEQPDRFLHYCHCQQHAYGIENREQGSVELDDFNVLLHRHR